MFACTFSKKIRITIAEQQGNGSKFRSLVYHVFGISIWIKTVFLGVGCKVFLYFCSTLLSEFPGKLMLKVFEGRWNWKQTSSRERTESCEEKQQNLWSFS